MKEVDYATFHVLERDSIVFKKSPDVTVFAEDKGFYYRDLKAIKK